MRASDLDVGDGNKPLNLQNGANVVLKWAPTVHRLYIKAKEADVQAATAPAAAASSGGDSVVNLDTCMELFTQAEKLGPDDLWHCPGCKEFRQATKKFDLWRLPPVLVVHLKRFSFKNKYWRDKLDTFVDFPLEGLDMTPRVLSLRGKPDAEPLVYDLYAISNHYGGLGGGHYTAYACNKDSKKWHKFDDSHVSPVGNPESVKTTAAYMLFYRLRSFHTPTYEEEPEPTATTAATTTAAAATTLPPQPAPSAAAAPSISQPPTSSATTAAPVRTLESLARRTQLSSDSSSDDDEHDKDNDAC
jgi:hypothetical protein